MRSIHGIAPLHSFLSLTILASLAAEGFRDLREQVGASRRLTALSVEFNIQTCSNIHVRREYRFRGE